MTEAIQARVYGPPAEEDDLNIPDQGNWTEEKYLRAFPHRGYELCNGFVEVIDYLTDTHQSILGFLYRALREFSIAHRPGKVQIAGLRVRLWEKRICEPDIVFMLAEHANRRENRYWHGADLTMEIINDDDPDDDPNRDLKTKRADYAKAGIQEYWIVDPRDRSITVLTLPDGETEYREAGRYVEGQTAASVLLDGFHVNVTDAFNAE